MNKWIILFCLLLIDLICISTTTESNLDETIDKLRKITDDIKKEKEISKVIDASNVIRLNINSEIIFTTR